MLSRCLPKTGEARLRRSNSLPNRQRLILLGHVLLWSLTAASLRAELPLARLHAIFPAGGKAGTTFEVSVNGPDLDDATQIHFSSGGISATQKLSSANLPEA